MTPIFKLSGIGKATADALSRHGIATAEQLAGTSAEVLLAIPRIGPSRVKAILAAAQRAIGQDPVHAVPEPVAIRKSRPTVRKPARVPTRPAKLNASQPAVLSGLAADVAVDRGDATAAATKKTKKSRKSTLAEMPVETSQAEPAPASGKASKTSADKKTGKKAAAKKDKKKSGKKKSDKAAAKKKGKKADKKK